MNKYKCPECGGSGGHMQDTGAYIDGYGWMEEFYPCPSCNKGWVMLAVEERGCTHSTCIPVGVGLEDVEDQNDMCNLCQAAEDVYRPLSSEEVEEVYVHTQRDGYKLFQHCDKEHVLNGSILITLTYKGQPVKLIPWKEEG